MLHTSFYGTLDMRGNPLSMSLTKGSCLCPSTQLGTQRMGSLSYIIVSTWWSWNTRNCRGLDGDRGRLDRAVIEFYCPRTLNLTQILITSPNLPYPDHHHIPFIPNNDLLHSKRQLAYLAMTQTPSLNIQHILKCPHTTQSSNDKHLPLRIFLAQHLRSSNAPSPPMIAYTILPLSSVHQQEHRRPTRAIINRHMKVHPLADGGIPTVTRWGRGQRLGQHNFDFFVIIYFITIFAKRKINF